MASYVNILLPLASIHELGLSVQLCEVLSGLSCFVGEYLPALSSLAERKDCSGSGVAYTERGKLGPILLLEILLTLVVYQNFYIMCEIAQILIKAHAQANSWLLSSYPGKVRLPSDILRSMPSIEATNQVR